jgi:hypothetical protein
LKEPGSNEMTKTIIAIFIALMASAVGAISPTSAQAGQAVSQAVTYTLLKGSYSFGAPVNDDGNYPSAGTFTFDGKGHVSGVMSLNYSGDVCDGMTLNGTYTVNPGAASGSAVMSLTSVNTGNCGLKGNGDTLPVVLYIASGGNVIYFAEMDNESAGYFSDNFAFFGATATHY